MTRTCNAGAVVAAPVLPPRSRKLVKATPVMPMRSGFKACVELVVYPDGHAGIAVSTIEGEASRRMIRQADSLPLNDVNELRGHLLAIVDHLAQEAERS